jgi:hypothetical protein
MILMKNPPIFKKNVLRYPRLDTVLMIEETIKEMKGDLKTREIWKSLPKKVMWQTFQTTLEYLEYSGKIQVTKDKHVIWVWSPNQIEKLKEQGLIIK